MNEIINLNHISKVFYSDKGETHVLKDISFKLNKFEIVSILGPSGCGKSTILNILSHLEEPSSGDMKINGVLGYMFQKDNLMEWRNIYNNIIIGLEIKHSKTKENLLYADSLVNKYHLSDFKNYYPRELSGGMRQRVALIRTLVLKPDLLLLDEPFSALDAQTRLLVQNDVYNIIKEEKKSALVITHDISEAIALSDRIIVLSPRPCYIKQIIDIDIKDLNPTERRKNSNFSKYFNTITQLLDNKI